MTRARAALRNALAFLLGLLLAGTMIEGGIRLVTPQRDIAGWFVQDDALGFRLKPGYHQSYTYPSHGFTMEVKTNADGFRDGPWEPKRAAEGFRVLVLGDSFAFGYAIDIADRFDKHAAATLREQHGIPAVFFNTGVPGWGTSHQAALTNQLLDDLEPDAIVLLFCPNDPANDRGLALPALPNTDSLLHHPKEWLRRHSHTYRFALERYGVIRLALAQRQAVSDDETAERSEQTGFYITEEDWARTAGLVRDIQDAFTAIRPGGTLYLLSTDPLDTAVTDALRGIAENIGAIYLDYAAEYAALAPDERRTPWDPHWSPAVHAIVGQTVADALAHAP